MAPVNRRISRAVIVRLDSAAQPKPPARTEESIEEQVLRLAEEADLARAMGHEVGVRPYGWETSGDGGDGSEEALEWFEPGEKAATEPAFRVLLVERDEGLRQVLRAALIGFHNLRHGTQCRLDVIEAEDGREAWQTLESDRLEQELNATFDLAIVGMDLKQLPARELIQSIRDRELFRAKSIPVIAIGDSSEKTQSDALRAGADVFLCHPLQMSSLFASLQRLLYLEPYGM